MPPGATDARYLDGRELAHALAGLCGPLPHALTRDLARTNASAGSEPRAITTQRVAPQQP